MGWFIGWIDLKNVKKIIGCELDKNGQKQLRIVSFTDDTDPYLNTAGLMAVEHIFTLVSGNGSIFIQHSVGATKITSTHETFIERIRKDQILPLKP
jgi:hypothetical protein